MNSSISTNGNIRDSRASSRKHDGPRVKEDSFDVEQDEYHCDEKNLTLNRSRADPIRLHARFVRRIFRGVSDAFAKGKASTNETGRHAPPQGSPRGIGKYNS